MAKKHTLSTVKWTRFWGSLDIHIRKRNILLKKYSPRKNDFPSLRRIGVKEEDINKVYELFNSYREPLLFRKFTMFFKKDPITVEKWTNSKNTSEAFVKLFRIFHFNNFQKIKERFKEISLLYEINRKGEGRKYQGIYKGRGSINNIKGVHFSRLLNLSDKRSNYKALRNIKFEDSIILPIERKKGNRPIYKFIKLSRKNNKIVIRVSADSEKEYKIIRNALRTWFGVYIDTPDFQGDFKKLSSFLKNGESEHFTVTGVNYFHGNYSISIFPKYNKPENVTKFQLYKNKFSAISFPQEHFIKIRILHKEILTRGQVFIIFLTHQTSGIIGAIVLNLDDRGLNFEERRRIRDDFNSDFDLPLNEFISYKDLAEKEIYKKLLQNIPKRSIEIELRSQKSLSVYKKLLDKELLPCPIEQNQERYCTNVNCRLGFQRKLSGAHCKGCGERLLSDKKIIIERIDEEKVTKFISDSVKKLGFHANKLKRRLIKRNIFVVVIRNKEKFIEVIPITKSLDENQIEVLRFRYPNLLLLNSQENLEEFTQKDINVDELYEFIYALEKSKKSEIKKLIDNINIDGLERIRKYSADSSSRITNNGFYKDKNKISKNFGSELFEADCSILLSYIFGNSLWLGARSRGKAFPDGITAFPFLDTHKGCFIWDAKFSEGQKVVLGKKEKNENYIKYAKNNSNIKENGGLKGFVFIGNRNAPKNFLREYRKLIGKRRIKVSFIRPEHLLEIFKHYKTNENRINNNLKVKQIFIELMNKIFFSTVSGNKSFVLQNSYLKQSLENNRKKYKSIKEGKPLTK